MDSLRSLPILKGQVFLEVGPGSGAVTLSLLKRFPEVKQDRKTRACDLRTEIFYLCYYCATN